MRGFFRVVKWVFISVLILLAVSLSSIVLYNVTIPESTPAPEQLSNNELARLHEINHLRSVLGDEVWPGWGRMEIPTLLYNEEYAFLMGMDKPADGWIRVPYSGKEGDVWVHKSGKATIARNYPPRVRRHKPL